MELVAMCWSQDAAARPHFVEILSRLNQIGDDLGASVSVASSFRQRQAIHQSDEASPSTQFSSVITRCQNVPAADLAVELAHRLADIEHLRNENDNLLIEVAALKSPDRKEAMVKSRGPVKGILGGMFVCTCYNFPFEATRAISV